MSVTVRDRAEQIEIANTHVTLSIDRVTLRMRMAGPDGRALTGALPRALVDGRACRAHEAVSTAEEPIAGAMGPATRVTLRTRSDGPLDLVFSIEIGDRWAGAILSLAVRNRAEHAVAISALEPLSWRRGDGGTLELPGAPATTRWFRMGWQSWSPSGFPLLAERDSRPRLRLLDSVHYGPFTSPSPRGEHASDCATVLFRSGHPGLTLGFTSHDRFLNHIALSHQGARLDALHARVSTEGRSLAPGETLVGERLWLGLGGPDAEGLAEWAFRAGVEMKAPVPADSATGWCSWYQFFTRVRADDVRAATRTLAELRSPLETIQIDDGFQAAVGDWLEWDDAFPDGIAPLAREIRGEGFRAGLWLAPFLVSRTSRTAERHPDWILRSPRGKPRVANVNPSWKGTVCWALDPPHPEVRAWLGEIARTVRGFGFDYLKLDFLYAGALAGARHDPAPTLAEAYREGIGAIRDGAGEDSYLLGCGAPLGPSIGLFEGMRIGPDVAPNWRARAADRAFGIRAAPSAENSLRNVIARAPLHQRLWQNDPDCVLLRDRDTKLSAREVRTLAGAITTSGGLVLVSDDLANLSAERRALLSRMLPALPGTPELPVIDREIPERMLLRLPDRSALLFATNLAWRTRRLRFDLAALGLPARVRVYDVWGERMLPDANDVLVSERLRSRESLLLRLAPDDGVARVLGSTLHLGGGALETAGLNAGDGEGRLSLRLPGPRAGKLWVATGPGEPVALCVGFEDELDLALGQSGSER